MIPDDDSLKLDAIKHRPKPVVLLLLDGFGVAPENEGNAITSAKTPNIEKIIKSYPLALLSAGEGSINARYLSLGCGQNIADENINVNSCFSETLSLAGLKQLKISETLRFAALANFFNGRHDEKFPLEDWRVISSVSRGKEIKRSSVVKKIFSELLKEISKDSEYDFIAVSVPNIEITAASGDFEATKKAVSEIDFKLKELLAKIIENKACLIISSAAGNAEKMLDFSTDTSDRYLTSNPVPMIIIGPDYEGKTIGLADPLGGDLSLLAPAGTLADLAPTIISIMGLEKPSSMEGTSLVDGLNN